MEDRFRFRVFDYNENKMIYFNSLIGIETPHHDRSSQPNLYNDYVYHKISNYMQSTGLKDRNGKLIYEGDIVRAKYYPFYRKEDGKYNYYAEICWDKESASFFYYTFCISKDVQGISTGNTGEISEYKWEIIGNIYENKELLKEEK